MKAVIISELNNSFKKLVWIEECKGGVYLGFCGKAKDLHYSYHKDGTVHIKHGCHYLHLYKTEAINNIKSFVRITSYGITLEKGYEFATSDYVRGKDSDFIIYINPEIIKRGKILQIDSFIVRKGREKDCINSLKPSYNSIKEQSFEVINASFLNLDKFRGFLIGIMLQGGK